tara:strand:+ start:1949 stop:2236 length:288 start_codon:yes stop_codon:yes gene_type:complete
MEKKNIEQLTLTSIECVFKKDKSNRIKMELLNDNKKKIEIYFELFWNKDTPENIIKELLNDARIEIKNEKDFIKYLNILNKKDPRLIKIKQSSIS